MAVRALLTKLAMQDFGYPLGVNEVRDPSPQYFDLPSGLQPLYAVCDGVSMPDVHIGYFIDRASRAASARVRGEPTQIQGIESSEIHVFGSDGGGGRFALESIGGAVYYLPSAGAVNGGAFIADDVARPQKVAEQLIDFLWLIQEDVEAFVMGRRGHIYIDQRTGGKPVRV